MAMAMATHSAEPRSDAELGSGDCSSSATRMRTGNWELELELELTAATRGELLRPYSCHFPCHSNGTKAEKPGKARHGTAGVMSTFQVHT
jgi:hypothetical protein